MGTGVAAAAGRRNDVGFLSQQWAQCQSLAHHALAHRSQQQQDEHETMRRGDQRDAAEEPQTCDIRTYVAE